jgi:hypothetical protein
MKRIWVVIAVSLLAACGGGSSSPNGTSAHFTDTATLPAGVLKVTLTPGSDAPPGKELNSVTQGENLRLVMRNETLRTEGVIFQLIQDVAPGSSLTLTPPAATGYTVEALTYTSDPATGLNTVVTYAQATNVTVDASGVSNAVLTLNPVAAALVLPSSILQGAKYSVLANLSTAGGRRVSALQADWFLNTPKTTTFAPFVNRTSITRFAASHSYSAPFTGGVPTNLYFQGVFTVKPSLLKSGERAKQWIFNPPEASLPVTAPINLTIIAPMF